MGGGKASLSGGLVAMPPAAAAAHATQAANLMLF
jgi:hypothetical protein